jgi:flagellar biosynthesis protein FlhG
MKRTSTVVAVVSGKGGVGKSIVAANLADSLAIEGHRVALVDADLAQGAAAILLNERPLRSLGEVARGEGRFEDAFHEVITGLTLVECAREMPDVPRRSARIFEVMDLALETLADSHQVVIVDCGAGIGDSVQWALDRCDAGLLVLVDEPTAVADAYRLVKHVWTVAPELSLLSVVNHVDSADEATSVSDRFGSITSRFTGLRPCPIGWVPFSRQVRTSVRDQVPCVRTAGTLRNRFQEIGHGVLGARNPETALECLVSTPLSGM